MKKIKYLILILTVGFFIVSCSQDNLGTAQAIDLSKKVAKSDNSINTATLPQTVLDYITANYPNNTVKKAEIENNGNFEVTLDNDIELIFDVEGQFLGVDDDSSNDYGDSDVALSDLPQVILDFITANYPNETITEAELENNENYEVELSDHTDLVFDADGNFLGIGVDQDDMDDENDENENEETNIDPATLPQIVLDYITANYPNETIIQAETESNGNYEVTLGNGIEVYFDSNGNFLRIGDGDDDGDGDGD